MATIFSKPYNPSLLCLCIFLQFLMLIHITKGAQDTTNSNYIYALCPDITTVSSNSQYQTNINTLLSNFSSNSTHHKQHFYNLTIGTNPNKIYGLFFCSADVKIDTCRKCVSRATNALTTRCPGKKVSIVWYFDQCVVRYSNTSYLGTMTDHPMIPMWNRENTLDIWNVTSDMNGFMNIVLDALRNASGNASSGPIDNKFATKEMRFGSNLTNINTIYALAQCTPDISLKDCKSCLNMVIGNTSGLCNEKTGCTLMCPNCNMRYDIFPFYGDKAVSGLPPFTEDGGETQGNHNKKRTAIIEGVAIAAASIGLLLIAVGILILKRRYNKSASDLEGMETEESFKFDSSKIRAATNNFSEDKKLGEGGFGAVFKGKLDTGEEIAVKRLSKHSIQGIEEFKTEVLLVAKLQHRNLVKLLGFSLSKSEKLLVYEYLKNSSLDRYLFDPIKCASLDWSTRYKIISGIAKGLLYLHEDSRLTIIHRDLKSSNVLLDKDMNPKISDFGTARLFGADQTRGMTSRIAGTFGYMAPEYVITGQFSVKSDVYSFGVLVLEIVSGQRNMFFRQAYEESLIERAWKHWNAESVMELIDTRLRDNFSREEVAKCIQIGLLCIQEDASKRPKMASIVASLNGEAIVFPLPTSPHFFTLNAFEDFEQDPDASTSTDQKNSIVSIDPR